MEEDQAAGMRWYRKAAEQGFAPAQYQLGNIYHYGNGVEEDKVEALHWYRRGCRTRTFTCQDWSKTCRGAVDAQELIPKANAGDANAQYRLSEAYEYGKGVKLDRTKAIHWLRQAAENGHVEAQFSLGSDYSLGWHGLERDHAEANRWFRKAAEQGHAWAQSYLGHNYFLGRGVPQNYAQAVHWSRQAADQGRPEAQFMLGDAYYNGWGVPQNFVEAYVWFSLCAAQRDASWVPAKDNMDTITLYHLTSDQIAKAQNLATRRHSRIEARKAQNQK